MRATTVVAYDNATKSKQKKNSKINAMPLKAHFYFWQDNGRRFYIVTLFPTWEINQTKTHWNCRSNQVTYMLAKCNFIWIFNRYLAWQLQLWLAMLTMIQVSAIILLYFAAKNLIADETWKLWANFLWTIFGLCECFRIWSENKLCHGTAHFSFDN